MASITLPSRTLIGHATFSRSIESHGSAHSADTTCPGWRGQGTITSEDIGTQTDPHLTINSASGSMTGSGKMYLGEIKRRRDETIMDISLESMKYNGGRGRERERKVCGTLLNLLIHFSHSISTIATS